jgi:hypothetical protein
LDDGSLFDDLFEFFCEKRVDDLIDVDRVMAIVDAACTEERIGFFQRRFLVPLRERLFERFAASDETLGRWLPEGPAQAIRERLARPVRVPQWVVDELVTSDALRDEIRAMVELTIADTMKKGGGLVGWGARAAAKAGKGILGGVGDAVQRGIEDRMRDFIDGGVAAAQQRIAKRLMSKDTARDLGKRRKRAWTRLLERSEREAVEALRNAPWPLLDSIFAPTLRHALTEPDARAAMRHEIQAALDEVAAQTIGDLFDDFGLRAEAKRWLAERGAPLAREFAAWRATRSSTRGGT